MRALINLYSENSILNLIDQNAALYIQSLFLNYLTKISQRPFEGNSTLQPDQIKWPEYVITAKFFLLIEIYLKLKLKIHLIMLLTLASLMEVGCWMGHHACLVLRISWLWFNSSRYISYSSPDNDEIQCQVFADSDWKLTMNVSNV